MLSNSISFNKLIISRILLIFIGFLTILSCEIPQKKIKPFTKTTTLAGFNREFGEPFGIAVDKNGLVYASDGETGKIFRVQKDGKVEMISDKFHTPSAIAFENETNLIIADSGSHTIKRLNVSNGEISNIAGVENSNLVFNAPIGVAVSKDGKIYVADTYNDQIKVIENGKVLIIAGSQKGFANGNKENAKFDTPCGIAILNDGSLLVADTGNRRLRRIDADGNVTTFAGTGEQDTTDNFPLQANFVEPTAVTVSESGMIYVADGNSIRVIGRRTFAFVETISETKRGLSDGRLLKSKFNRPSSIASDNAGTLFIADSENQVIRVLTGDNLGREIKTDEIAKLRFSAEEFRNLQPPRWTYNPPDAKRDIAGTLGEVRGDYKADDEQLWFHNGLDIAGGYGEKSYFIRNEKVLQPIAVADFGGLRERLRLPTIGYIHLRLGRDKDDKPFGDGRFQLIKENEKIINVRIPRGTKFEAGEAVGTLNSFNHVHLIAGRTGAEMNALDALTFPNISDKIVPIIEKVSLFKDDWSPIETEKKSERIKLQGKIRITAQAFDRMDGNPERRKLGVYKLGYQILQEDKSPLFEPKWTISFEKMPDMEFVKLVYARGSKSGYTPETVFDYIVTNEVLGDKGKENFLDVSQFGAGNYILRISVADFFGNIASKDLQISIEK